MALGIIIELRFQDMLNVLRVGGGEDRDSEQDGSDGEGGRILQQVGGPVIEPGLVFEEGEERAKDGEYGGSGVAAIEGVMPPEEGKEGSNEGSKE